METRISVDILSDLECEGERSEVEKPNYATPLETEKLRIQKASTSNAPMACIVKMSLQQQKLKTNRNAI